MDDVDVLWICGGQNVDDVDVLCMCSGQNVDDVDILRRACGTVRSLFIDLCQFDPFTEVVNISQAAAKIWRKDFMPPETVAIIPAQSEYVQIVVNGFQLSKCQFLFIIKRYYIVNNYSMTKNKPIYYVED